MRTLHLVIFLVLYLPVLLSSQSKQDYYWPFGNDKQDAPGVQAIEFDFNNRPFEVGIREGELEFDQNNASICDEDGNLLIYTNGCAVANRNHEVMPHGDSLNYDRFFVEWWGGDCSDGYPGEQNVTILPDPGYGNGYYILHQPISYNPDSMISFTMDMVLYSYVDMTLDNGLGDVVEKNVKFHNGPVLNSYLSVIKKPDSNAWWILFPARDTGFFLYEINSNGIEYVGKQLIGPEYQVNSSSSGRGRFSPDGKKYCIFNQFDGVNLYDFDRATGILSNFEQIPWEPPVAGLLSGSEWSSNSRFIYLVRADTLWQLDTSAEPLEDGLLFLQKHSLEGSRIDNPWYGNAALGPDCKIYIRGRSSARSMHVIHKPNELGTACDFEEQAIQLPFTTGVGSFPNFPRFRVDEVEKCDPSITSMFGDEIFWRRDMTVFPNPASDQITVELPELQTRGQIYIVDMLGQVVLEREAFGSGQMAVDISVLPVGRYSVEYVPEDNAERVVYTAALVVI